jgi:hypothetical protein
MITLLAEAAIHRSCGESLPRWELDDAQTLDLTRGQWFHLAVVAGLSEIRSAIYAAHLAGPDSRDYAGFAFETVIQAILKESDLDRGEAAALGVHLLTDALWVKWINNMFFELPTQTRAQIVSEWAMYAAATYKAGYHSQLMADVKVATRELSDGWHQLWLALGTVIGKDDFYFAACQVECLATDRVNRLPRRLYKHVLPPPQDLFSAEAYLERLQKLHCISGVDPATARSIEAFAAGCLSKTAGDAGPCEAETPLPPPTATIDKAARTRRYRTTGTRFVKRTATRPEDRMPTGAKPSLPVSGAIGRRDVTPSHPQDTGINEATVNFRKGRAIPGPGGAGGTGGANLSVINGGKREDNA